MTDLEPREFNLGRAATEGGEFRSRNSDEGDQLKADSLDFYARIRSLYHQSRENEINNGTTPGEVPTFGEAPGPGPSSLELRRAEPSLANDPCSHCGALRHLAAARGSGRSEEHTSELQSLMRTSYADFCLIKKTHH